MAEVWAMAAQPLPFQGPTCGQSSYITPTVSGPENAVERDPK